MSGVHAALFYPFGAIALAGALLAAFARGRAGGAAGLLLVALGAALVVADLSGGFAAVLVLVALLGAAAVAASAPVGEGALPVQNWAGIAAALAFAALAYAAYRGAFHSDRYPGGEVDFTSLGRTLVDRNPLGVIATAAAAAIAFGLAGFPARRRPAAPAARPRGRR